MLKSNQTLQKKRILVDQVDKKILKLLKKRFQYIGDIQKIKVRLKLATYNKKREREIIERAKRQLGRHKNKKQILKIFKLTLSESLSSMLT